MLFSNGFSRNLVTDFFVDVAIVVIAVDFFITGMNDENAAISLYVQFI